MATASVTYTFTPGGNADGTQVNTNFSQLVAFLNGSVVQTDGSASMSGQLTLLGSDPVAANHATRKSYVDAADLLATQRTPQRTGIGLTGATWGIGPNNIGQVTITDPGYDIEVWGSAITIVDTFTSSSLWELQTYVDAVLQSALRVPMFINFQSMGVVLPRTVHVTGSNCVVNAGLANSSGGGTIHTTGDSNRSFLEVFWRRKYP